MTGNGCDWLIPFRAFNRSSISRFPQVLSCTGLAWLGQPLFSFLTFARFTAGQLFVIPNFRPIYKHNHTGSHAYIYTHTNPTQPYQLRTGLIWLSHFFYDLTDTRKLYRFPLLVDGSLWPEYNNYWLMEVMVPDTAYPYVTKYCQSKKELTIGPGDEVKWSIRPFHEHTHTPHVVRPTWYPGRT